MLITESIETFLGTSQSENTQRSRETAIKSFVEFLRERVRREPQMDDLYDMCVVDFEKWLLKRGLKPRSTLPYIFGLQKWLRVALIKQALPDGFSLPRADALRKEMKTEAVYYHEKPEFFDAIPKLVAHLNKRPVLDADSPKGKYIYLIKMRNRALAWFLFNTNSRRGATRSLKLNQVLDEEGDLRETITVIGKRNKEYLLVLDHPAARKALEEYLDARKKLRPDNSPFVFISHDHDYGEPIAGATVYSIINTAAKEIGLNYSPHDLRHYWALYKLNHGLSMDEVSAGLGHASPSITATVYAHHKHKNLAEKIKGVPMPSAE